MYVQAQYLFVDIPHGLQNVFGLKIERQAQQVRAGVGNPHPSYQAKSISELNNEHRLDPIIGKYD